MRRERDGLNSMVAAYSTPPTPRIIVRHIDSDLSTADAFAAVSRALEDAGVTFLDINQDTESAYGEISGPRQPACTMRVHCSERRQGSRVQIIIRTRSDERGDSGRESRDSYPWLVAVERALHGPLPIPANLAETGPLRVHEFSGDEGRTLGNRATHRHCSAVHCLVPAASFCGSCGTALCGQHLSRDGERLLCASCQEQRLSRRMLQSWMREEQQRGSTTWAVFGCLILFAFCWAILSLIAHTLLASVLLGSLAALLFIRWRRWAIGSSDSESEGANYRLAVWCSAMPGLLLCLLAVISLRRGLRIVDGDNHDPFERDWLLDAELQLNDAVRHGRRALALLAQPG